MDAIDRKILKILQQDATATVAEVGRAAGLFHNALLEAHPETRGQRDHQETRSDRRAREQAVDAFIQAVCAMPEVLEFQRVAGDANFSLRVVTVDVPHYEQVWSMLPPQ